MNLTRDQASSILNSRKWTLDNGIYLMALSDPQNVTMVCDIGLYDPRLLFFLGSKDDKAFYTPKRTFWELITLQSDPVLHLFQQIRDNLIQEKNQQEH